MIVHRLKPGCPPAHRRVESGIASILVLVVLFLLVALLTASSRMVFHLKQEIDLVDQRQSQRPPPSSVGKPLPEVDSP
ncbi:MAG: hypothetical protein H7A45_14960 [Verrucomicrobiales bacterium]|nr:hypothetical protein [Verrucomicrobiales bacterium]MCP5526138.1 hypothetical protein [Verrucomicrobiales bacterium]